MSIRTETTTGQMNEVARVSALSANRILSSLPAEDYVRIAGHLISVPMRAKERLYRQDAPVEGVYFPGGGACALVKTTEDGHTLQIGIAGAEGAIGISTFFGLHRHPCDVIVHLAGPEAQMLPVRAFASEMEHRGAFYDRIIRYNQAMMMELMQAAACNGLHSAAQRFARWLLSMHDRAGHDQFPFTHDLAATMLGLRRPTVTLTAKMLQDAGFIAYQRGIVRIVDRVGLEGASCGCHRELTGTVRTFSDVRSAPSH